MLADWPADNDWLNRKRMMLVYGHRGAAGEAPENTIAGFRHAIDRGVRYIELDVRLSKDDQLVVVHDDTVNRTTFHKGRIKLFTAAELSKMDARRDGPPWPHKRQIGISTLDAVLAATTEIAGYNIEVKAGPKTTMRRIAEILAEQYNTPTTGKNIVVTSSDLIFHEALMDIAPHITRGYVSIRPNPFPIVEEYECQYLSIIGATCNVVFVRHAHKLG
ncbi:MAG: glycerophosphodiester phosphodiesterase, partial [Pseudomonadales bacterium]